MADKIEISDYLETATEISRRVRFTTIVLAVVTVLILAGLLNSMHDNSWILNRIQFKQQFNFYLEKKIKESCEKLNLTNPPSPCPALILSSPTPQPTPALTPTPEPTPSAAVEKTPAENIPSVEATPEKTWLERLWEGKPPSLPPDKLKTFEVGVVKTWWENLSKEKKNFFESVPFKCGENTCESLTDNAEKFACLKCAKELNDNQLKDLSKSYIDNVYVVRVPFFGVGFDINDLGLLGGIALLIVLILLRLSLRTYIINQRIIFKALISRKDLAESEVEKFYEILATRQLFVFPKLTDPKQEDYSGKTETYWNASGLKRLYVQVKTILGFFYKGGIKRFSDALLKMLFVPSRSALDEIIKGFLVSITLLPLFIISLLLLPIWLPIMIIKRAFEQRKPEPETAGIKKGWNVNPQPWLHGTPKLISLIPTLVYFLVVYNDYISLDVGMVVNPGRTYFGFLSSVVFLLLIFLFGCWCVSKWFEIDYFWNQFYKKAFANGVGENDESLAEQTSPIQTGTNLSLYFPDPLTLDKLLVKLSALQLLYSELCRVLNIPEDKNTLVISQIKLESLWLKLFGENRVIKLLTYLIESGVLYLHRNYTVEGKINKLIKKAEVVKVLIKLTDELKNQEIDTTIYKQNVRIAADTLAEQLNKLLAGELHVEINNQQYIPVERPERKLPEVEKSFLTDGKNSPGK